MHLFIRALIVSLYVLTSVPYHSVYAVPLYERETPPYAKWGQLAVQKAKEKYPEAQIVDYLHIGREKKATTSIEKFKLWLKTDKKEFGLFINIEFDNRTERIVNISYKESTR